MPPASRTRRSQAKRVGIQTPQRGHPIPSSSISPLLPDPSFETADGAAPGTPSWGKLMGQSLRVVNLYADKLQYTSADLLPSTSAPTYLKRCLSRLSFVVKWSGYGIPGRGLESTNSGNWRPERMGFTVENMSPHRICVGAVELLQGQVSPLHWGQTIQLVDNEELEQSNLQPEMLQVVFATPNMPTRPPAPTDAFSAEFRLGSAINSGQFGKVFRAVQIFGGQEYAVKIIKRKLSVMSEAELGILERECEIMQQISSHPNIVSVHRTYMAKDQLYILMDLIRGGDLLDLVRDRHGLNEDDTRYIISQVITGMVHVHDAGIAHRDLKPENILLTLDNPPVVKIVDFGLAKHAHSRTALKTHCGTQLYAAPEVFSPDKKSYDISVDIWSIGVIMFTILTCEYPWKVDLTRHPFWSPSTTTMRKELLVGRLSPEGADLLYKMIVDDPRRRITLKEAMHHPWLHRPHGRPDAILSATSGSFSNAGPPTPQTEGSGSWPAQTTSLHVPVHSFPSFPSQLYSTQSANAAFTAALASASSFALPMPGGLPIDRSSSLLTPLPSLRSSIPSTDPPPAAVTPTRASARLKAKETSSLPRTRSASNMNSLTKRKAQAAALGARLPSGAEPPRMRTRSGAAAKKRRGMNPVLAV